VRLLAAGALRGRGRGDGPRRVNSEAAGEVLAWGAQGEEQHCCCCCCCCCLGQRWAGPSSSSVHQAMEGRLLTQSQPAASTPGRAACCTGCCLCCRCRRRAAPGDGKAAAAGRGAAAAPAATPRGQTPLP